MYYRWLWALALIVSLATYCDLRADDGAFTSGTLACVVELERADPKQPYLSKDKKLAVSAHSSGFIIVDPDPTASNRFYLVTAAHNLVDCTDVLLFHDTLANRGRQKQISIVDNRSKSIFKQFVYWDQAEDLAIFEWQKPYADYFLMYLPRQEANNDGLPDKIVGALWRKPNPNLDFPPRGGIASAAGTLDDFNELLKHPAYSCTISRYVTGKTLAPPLIPEYCRPSGPLGQFQRDVSDRINNIRFLIIESMSITAGFSGSPIMVSNDHFRSNGEIIGIVLGGENAFNMGRFAWAATSDTISKAIRTLASANDDGGIAGWTPVPDSKNLIKQKAGKQPQIPKGLAGEVLEDPAAAGRWVFSCDLTHLIAMKGDRFRTPYFAKFNIDSHVKFRGTDGFVMRNDDLKKRIEQLPGKSFVFIDIDFDFNSFDGVHLLTPYFLRCNFRGTRFYGSVLTGPTFVDCKLFNGNGKQVDIHTIEGPPCIACAPSAVIAAHFSTRGSDVQEDMDDLLIPLK